MRTTQPFEFSCNWFWTGNASTRPTMHLGELTRPIRFFIYKNYEKSPDVMFRLILGQKNPKVIGLAIKQIKREEKQRAPFSRQTFWPARAGKGGIHNNNEGCIPFMWVSSCACSLADMAFSAHSMQRSRRWRDYLHVRSPRLRQAKNGGCGKGRKSNSSRLLSSSAH